MGIINGNELLGMRVTRIRMLTAAERGDWDDHDAPPLVIQLSDGKRDVLLIPQSDTEGNRPGAIDTQIVEGQGASEKRSNGILAPGDWPHWQKVKAAPVPPPAIKELRDMYVFKLLGWRGHKGLPKKFRREDAGSHLSHRELWEHLKTIRVWSENKGGARKLGEMLHQELDRCLRSNAPE